METLVVYGTLAKNEVNGARQISFEELDAYSKKVLNHFRANNTENVLCPINKDIISEFEKENSEFFEKYGAGFKSFTEYQEAKGYKLKDGVSIDRLKEEKASFVPFSLKKSLMSKEAKSTFKTSKLESTRKL